MKPAFLLILTAFLFSSCKEAIEQAKEDAVIDAMTSGEWVVTSYTKAGNSMTNSFSGYTFQFKKNQTVDALKSSAVEKTGTWVGDGTKGTIQALFSNANETLTLLNGTWQITKTSWTSVDAYLVGSSEQTLLRLDKK